MYLKTIYYSSKIRGQTVPLMYSIKFRCMYPSTQSSKKEMRDTLQIPWCAWCTSWHCLLLLDQSTKQMHSNNMSHKKWYRFLTIHNQSFVFWPLSTNILIDAGVNFQVIRLKTRGESMLPRYNRVKIGINNNELLELREYLGHS